MSNVITALLNLLRWLVWPFPELPHEDDIP